MVFNSQRLITLLINLFKASSSTTDLIIPEVCRTLHESEELFSDFTKDNYKKDTNDDILYTFLYIRLALCI
jgi:hypothetical protein